MPEAQNRALGLRRRLLSFAVSLSPTLKLPWGHRAGSSVWKTRSQHSLTLRCVQEWKVAPTGLEVLLITPRPPQLTCLSFKASPKGPKRYRPKIKFTIPKHSYPTCSVLGLFGPPGHVRSNQLGIGLNHCSNNLIHNRDRWQSRLRTIRKIHLPQL